MHGARIRSVVLLLAFAAAALTACGGNPAGSDSQGVVVRGTVQGAGTLRAASVGATSAATVTVTVLENPSITTTVAGDGSFTLRGLPEGGFTLIFTTGGTEIGRLSFSEVKANQEITLTVQVSTSGVVLLEEQRNGIGHGDIEIEGDVTQVVALNPTGDSRFLINGHTVVARPCARATARATSKTSPRAATFMSRAPGSPWRVRSSPSSPRRSSSRVTTIRRDRARPIAPPARRWRSRGRSARSPAPSSPSTSRAKDCSPARWGARASARGIRRTPWLSSRRAGACTSRGRQPACPATCATSPRARSRSSRTEGSLARFLLFDHWPPPARQAGAWPNHERAGATSMKRALSVVLFLFVALAVAAPPAPAFQAQTARYYDLQRLQDDLPVLDDSLAPLPTSHPRYREVEDRATDLREELRRLRDAMDRGGRTTPHLSRPPHPADGLRRPVHCS